MQRSHSFALVALCAQAAFGGAHSSPEVLAAGRLPWAVLSEFGEQPICGLYGRAVREVTDTISIGIVWYQSDGLVLTFNGPLAGNPAIRIEAVGANLAWDVTTETWKRGFAARRVSMKAADIDELVRQVGDGRAIDVSVIPGDEKARHYRTPVDDARFAVPMYRACVDSLTRAPIRYTSPPASRFIQWAGPEGCGIGQFFDLGDNPLSVMLLVDGKNAELRFMRSALASTGSHGFKRRKVPDRMVPPQLHLADFDLAESSTHVVALEAANGIVDDLARGAAREFSIVEVDGKRSTFFFGGPLAQPSVAMFSACRKVMHP